MKARTTLACTLALLAAMLLSAEVNAQWGRGPGWQGPQWGGDYDNGWGYGNGWYGEGWGTRAPQGQGCLFGPRMAYLLGISRDQQDAIDALYLKALDSAKPLLRELDRTELELSALGATPKHDAKVAQELRKKARELSVKIDDIWSKYHDQVLSLLTPQQRQDYDRLAATRGPGCWGYGPGYGYGRGRYLRWERRGCWRGRGWGPRGAGWGWW